ncbi:MAG: hypothetical protein AB7O52_05410 [Planctomycetota bacterium]
MAATPSPRVSPPRPGERLRCAICAVVLTRDQEVRGQVCSRPECHRERATQVVADRARREQALRARGRAIADELGLDAPEARAIALTPSNDRRLTTNSRRRVGSFRDHLTRKISEAFADRDANPPPRYPPSGLSERDESLLGIACATCRGHCCSQGGTHAFVGAGTILRYLAQRPAARAREVLADYLSRIPARSYRGSCVYHAEGGCALPREMRSSTCNNYLCRGLWDFQTELTRLNTRSGLALAVDGEHVLRSGTIDELPAKARSEEGPESGTKP